MTGLDTNILARYYIAAPAGDGTPMRRSPSVDRLRRALDGGEDRAAGTRIGAARPLYGFDAAAIAGVLRHLLTLPHVTIEDRTTVEIALRHYTDGRNALDFADALHPAAYRHCQRMATFNDRKFARCAARLQLRTKVEAPGPA